MFSSREKAMLYNLPNELISEITSYLSFRELLILLDIKQYRDRMRGLFKLLTNHHDAVNFIKDATGLDRFHIMNYQGSPGEFQPTIYLFEIKNIKDSLDELQLIQSKFNKCRCFISLIVTEDLDSAFQDSQILSTFVHEITKSDKTSHVQIKNINPLNQICLKNSFSNRNALLLQGHIKDISLNQVIITKESPMLIAGLESSAALEKVEIISCSQGVIDSLDFSSTTNLSITEPDSSSPIFKDIQYHDGHCKKFEHEEYRYYDFSHVDFHSLEIAHFKEFSILEDLNLSKLTSLKLNLRFQTMILKPAKLQNLKLPNLVTLSIDSEEVTPDLVNLWTPSLKNLTVNVFQASSKLGGFIRQTVGHNNKRKLQFELLGATLENVELTNCLDILMNCSFDEGLDLSKVKNLTLCSTIGFPYKTAEFSSPNSMNSCIQVGSQFKSLKSLKCCFRGFNGHTNEIDEDSYLPQFLGGLCLCGIMPVKVTKNGIPITSLQF